MRKLATFILLYILTCTYVCAGSFTPKREIRAVWLTTLGGLDWPKTHANSTSSINKQKQELCDILDKLYDSGFNTVLFQVRTRSAVLYPSELEPWAECLTGRTGKAPGYDPLAFAIDECHKRGMELHAWVTTVPSGKWNSQACRILRKKLPGTVKRVGADGFMDPGKETTSVYLSKICNEIVSRYDVDGIHLDYIRYPENYRLKIPSDRARNNITHIVEQISSGVKSTKPWIKLSCSPIGKHADLVRYSSRGWNARDRVYQDAQQWLHDGTMDILFPMMYFRNEHYFPFLQDWAENKYDGYIAAGLGIYMLSPTQKNWNINDITRQMYAARQWETGYALFRYKFLAENTKGIADYIKNTFNVNPALTPITKSNGIKEPEAPVQLDVKYSDNHYFISWDEGRTYDKSGYCTYNIYASDTYPVDTEDSRNLVLCRFNKNKAIIKRLSGHKYFAVTTYDRYGKESSATQESIKQNNTESSITVCENDTVLLRNTACDMEYIIIESLQGNIISTIRYSDKGTDIKCIPSGIYVLRSLNKKGISHRLGIMLKK